MAQPVSIPTLFPGGLASARQFSDFDEMAATLSCWNLDTCQLEGGAFSGSLALAHTVAMQIQQVRLSPAVLVRGSGAPNSYVLATQTHGVRQAYWRNRAIGDLEVVAFHGEEDLDLQTVSDSELTIVAIEKQLWEEYAATNRAVNLKSASNDIRFSMQSSSRSNLLKRRWTELVNAALQLGIQLCDETVARQFEASILDVMFSNVVPIGRDASLVERRRLAHRSRNYMLQNMDCPMTIKEICQANGGTERTLHLGFRESFGISPKKFLKVLRLNAARRELQNPKFDTTVTKVSLRWGFFHLARFAAEYSTMFGELPSQTLRQALGC